MTITAFKGPMWSGKTQQLLNICDDYYKQIINFDAVNTRNSKRDLHILKPEIPRMTTFDELLAFGRDKRRTKNAKKKILIIVDEVHLYQVFQKAEILLNVLEEIQYQGYNAAIAGIIYDGFKDCNFSIWSLVDLYCNSIVMLPSLKACANCKCKENVWFSLPMSKEKIGDKYYNLCRNCFLRDINKQKIVD
jgi:thymidine kinase